MYDYSGDIVLPSDTSFLLDSPYVGDGWVTVLVAIGVDVGFTAATGFTTLAAGTGTRLGYWVGWRRLDGTETEYEVPVTGLPGSWDWGTAPDPTRLAFVLQYTMTEDYTSPPPGALPATAAAAIGAVTETASAHSVDVPTPPVNFGYPLQLVFGLPDPDATNSRIKPTLTGTDHWNNSQWTPPETGFDTAGVCYVENSWYTIDGADADVPLAGTCEMQAGEFPGDTWGADLDAEWLTFTIGFTQ
jgi:hypothetical protein